MASRGTHASHSDPVFYPDRFQNQAGWFDRGVLHWYAPDARPEPPALTLVMDYDGVYAWQRVAIDGTPGTVGLALDPLVGSVVRGGLAIVWRGWLGEFVG